MKAIFALCLLVGIAQNPHTEGELDAGHVRLLNLTDKGVVTLAIGVADGWVGDQAIVHIGYRSQDAAFGELYHVKTVVVSTLIDSTWMLLDPVEIGVGGKLERVEVVLVKSVEHEVFSLGVPEQPSGKPR